MLNATKEIHDSEDGTGVSNKTCMFDGTWQRRGFSSLVGDVTYMSADN